jgi:hypothetical protein
VEKTPLPPPFEEQLPGGARAEDVKHMFAGSTATHVAKAAEAGTSPEADVLSGRAEARAREMERGAAEGRPTVAGEAATVAGAAATRLKKAALGAYNKAADKIMGSLDGDSATCK